MPLAILQMSDTPQIESSAIMLRNAGYEVKVCDLALAKELQAMGLDGVTPIESAISFGCDTMDPTIQRATTKEMGQADLWCDIKVNNFEKVWLRWPNLQPRSIFWRVNGGIPEHAKGMRNGRMIDFGDERHPPAPAVTNNFWYTSADCEGRANNYTFWPPYARMTDYNPNLRPARPTAAPIGICHSVRGWGFGVIVDECVKMGVDIYGMNSPKGMIQHMYIANLLANALCMVHTKSTDCPGWALYESLLAACPVVLPRWLVRMGAMDDLYEHGVTCLLFGVDCDATGRGDAKFDQCVAEIRDSIAYLRNNPDQAKRIGMSGRERLLNLMWNTHRDGPAFNEYLKRVIK